MSYYAGTVDYAPTSGTVARQESHTVEMTETNGNLINYSFVVDGTATPGGLGDAEDFTTMVDGYTLATGSLQGGSDNWTIDGGIVEQTFAGPAGTGSLSVTLDGQAVTPRELVTLTGGVHPDEVAIGCQNDVDCTGDLVCDGSQCTTPPGGLPQCSTGTDCQGDLVCENGQCALPPFGELPQCERDVHCAGSLTCRSGRCVGEGGEELAIAAVVVGTAVGAGLGAYFF